MVGFWDFSEEREAEIPAEMNRDVTSLRLFSVVSCDVAIGLT
jgi:hypothetical protein